MAAIAGLFGAHCNEPAAERDVGRMLEALRRRAPGGAVVHADVARQVMLGMRGPAGEPERPRHGVFANSDGSLRMVCDGEVFNAAEVGSWLAGKGYTTKTKHSAELLLYLYEAEGPAGWKRADAQFAVAIFDQRRGRLTLGRDFLGVRALYYHACPKGVVFASEIKALLEHRTVPLAYDPVAVSHYLSFLSVPEPRTLFADIKKLSAGTVAEIRADGAVTIEEYWDLLQDPIPERGDERFYVERVRELHETAVRGRLVDGPIASLLSGGNDSSANAALIARENKGQVHTFTVGLECMEGEPKYTDLYWARRVAQHIGAQHRERLLSVDEFLATIPITIDVMDDLVSEPSSIFLHHALQMVKEQGLRVVLTGEANDELSCGHGEMIHVRDSYYRKWLPYMRLPGALRHIAATVGAALSPRRRDILRRAANGDEYFWSFDCAWSETEKPDVLTALGVAASEGQPAQWVVERDAERVRASEHGRRDFMNRMIYAMMQDYYFGNLMLGKLDLLAGNLGLDARAPYTAPAYAHFVFNIPSDFKSKNGTVKHFFKQAIRGLLPDEVIDRPKQGFRTPVQELFAGRLGDWAQPHLFEEGLSRDGFLRRDALRALLAEHRTGKVDRSNKLWTAMVLNLWYERWIRGGRSATSPRRAPTVGALDAGSAEQV